jgi:hypothetical protein
MPTLKDLSDDDLHDRVARTIDLIEKAIQSIAVHKGEPLAQVITEGVWRPRILELREANKRLIHRSKVRSADLHPEVIP